jgi:DNA-binding IclR family transcriptional regulator
MPPELLTRCNVSSIAAAIGLNRETARRKVQSLLDAEILLADAKGSIPLHPEFIAQLRTSEMRRSQLQTVIQTANGLLKEGIVHVTRENPA